MLQALATRSRGQNQGFTLIEVMVAVAVLGIIIAVAYPAYTAFLERGRRSEATEALQNLSTRQEQFYNDNKFYAGDLATLGAGATTANGYYQLSITAGAMVGGTLQGYTVNANAQGPQSGDTGCTTIQLDSDGSKTPEQCW